MKVIVVMALLVTSFSLSVPAMAQQRKKAQVHGTRVQSIHKVVMQLSSADSLEHKGLMNNLKNLTEGWGDSVLVEVVVHGPGIDLVTKGKSTQQQALQAMMAKGVKFVVCRNTMKQRNISEDQILPNIGFVQMGVGEIIQKQEQGWSYLKAGF